ncbi:MAG: flagellar protein FliT [Sulfuritalea sp.]|nr:flagellar protein FliT [Sulfuritalea sp.]
MLSMPAKIDRYEEICSLSARMVNAARSGDWDLLITLESRVAALRDEMIAETDQGREAMASSPEVDRRRGLIQQILVDDAEIRRHTEPWMEHVRQLLGGHSRRRKVQQAYAATDGGADLGVENKSRT